jgi:hypothetical protein
MKDKRFWFGVVVSVLWLAWMGLQWYSIGSLPEKLNERGDFFAGYFAPLAFLWLVIGYLQQGDELRQSTEALRLQAEELKNSVEQQSLLVEVSRQQLEQEAAAIRQERQLREEAAHPLFSLSHRGSTGSLALFDVQLALINDGGTAVKTVVELDQPKGRTTVVDKVTIKGDASHAFNIHMKGDSTFVGEIRWSDIYGNRGHSFFRVRMDGHDLTIIQPISPGTLK